MMTDNMMKAMDLLFEGNFRRGVVAKAKNQAYVAAETLEVLKKSDKPLRVKEIVAQIPQCNTTGQQVTSLLRTLVSAGAVKRVETGEKEFISINGDFGRMVPIVKYIIV